ncbi:MAG: nitronate monooxygenase [Elusimicrobia bacterium HGW-Elusimicrobia-1]|jgi:nitronate monooxygenase|nr:MAG: nitronate monooxygenase [Elusimicrobia bacterium HGW-Elusimicrobia-1]
MSPKTKLPDLVIGDLHINPPIVQGGMGVRISLNGLASAVAEAGGVGTIACALIGGIKSHMSSDDHTAADTDELAFQIRESRKKTKGVIAVNIMMALTNYDALYKTAVREGVDIIFSGAGLPLRLPEYVKGSKTKIAPIVSSGRATELIAKTWLRKYNYTPDAIVLEGPLAGGHLGYTFEELEDKAKMPKWEEILPDVVAVANKYVAANGRKIPVIVGGGIFDGKDIAKALRLGAAGVQIATRFAATVECDAHENFKKAIVACKEEDITIIKSPVGMPGRALSNSFLEKAKSGQIKFDCSFQCLHTCDPLRSPYCIATALIAAAEGRLDDGFVFVGQNAGRVKSIMPVRELINELVAETEQELGLK